MSKTFNFNGETTYYDSIDIESIGNVCLELIDDLDRSFYLVIRTSLGETTCLEYGPLIPDEELLPDTTSIYFQRFEYSEATIMKIIRTFLLPRKVGRKVVKISSVRQLDFHEALSYGIDIFKYLSDYSDTSNY